MTGRDLSGALLSRLDWLSLDYNQPPDFRRLVQGAANRLRSARVQRNAELVSKAFDDACRLLDAWGVELFPASTRKSKRS